MAAFLRFLARYLAPPVTADHVQAHVDAFHAGLDEMDQKAQSHTEAIGSILFLAGQQLSIISHTQKLIQEARTGAKK